jgi:4'-phosphopantetheinyl transferase
VTAVLEMPRLLRMPAAGVVEVWSADLGRDPAPFESLLSGDEVERANSFYFPRDRRRFVIGRGIVRTLLGEYVGRAPSGLVFSYGPHGRPDLDGIAFNVSHSGDRAVLAVASGGDVGVDIEELRPEPAEEQVAERFFSPSEVVELRALPADQQPRAFLSCWTRKEAFIKALGDGLSLALDSFDVTLRPGEPPALTRTAWSSSEPARWRVRDLSSHFPGYVAALATRGTGTDVLVRDWID